jgi:hypothetical protein
MDDERPDVFLQWKGTNACMDFWCTCGADLHFDGYFAHELTCGHCGQTWEMPSKFTPLPVKPSRSLTLVFDENFLPETAGAEFTIRWPRPVFDAAVPGGIVEIHDLNRACYADLLKVQPAEGMVMLTLRLRGGV